MGERCAIELSENFNTIVKQLKSVIEPFFLDNHRSISLKIKKNSNTIKCFVNMGRLIATFEETPKVLEMEGITDDIQISLSIEELKNRIDTTKEPIRLVIKPQLKQAFFYQSGLKFSVKQVTPPEEIDLPYIDIKTSVPEHNRAFANLLGNCYQRDLITIKSNFIYEKISKNLYHIEKYEFPDNTFSYKDIKIIANIMGSEDFYYVSAPRYHTFCNSTIKLYVLKYNLDTIDEKPFLLRKNMKKDGVVNYVLIDKENFKNILNGLIASGNTTFTIGIGTNAYCCGEDTVMYPLITEIKVSKTFQTCILSKAELLLILKNMNKAENIIKIVGFKTFVLINGKFVVLLGGTSE